MQSGIDVFEKTEMPSLSMVITRVVCQEKIVARELSVIRQQLET